MDETLGPSELDALITRIPAGLRQLGSLFTASLRPLPTETGDYSYLNAQDLTPFERLPQTLLENLAHLGIQDASTLMQVGAHAFTGDLVDDKNLLMERLIQVGAALPVDNHSGRKISQTLITQLWNDLDHPPMSYLGDKVIYVATRSRRTSG